MRMYHRWQRVMLFDGKNDIAEIKLYKNTAIFCQTVLLSTTMAETFQDTIIEILYFDDTNAPHRISVKRTRLGLFKNVIIFLWNQPVESGK